jgi:acetylornithine deacetylase/succinyl-diaminopimelate desuccinylase-like protein
VPADLARAAPSHDVVSLTRRLVAASSQNPGQDERVVASVVEHLCAELGLPGPRRIGLEERPNLFVEVAFGAGGRRLGLCAHTDTKPVGDGEWGTDPLDVAQVDGELRGLGVVDMKGALAAMLLATADLLADPPARGAVVLVLCADEENGATFGARWLAEHAPPDVDAMVIGEPGGLEEDWDRLHLGSRGICNFDVEIVTRQGHSGLRDVLGLVSATEVAARLVVDLRERFVPPHPKDPRWAPTLNPGVVLEGGIGYGVVPGRARVASDCRLVPGMDRLAFESAIRGFVEDTVVPSARADVVIRNWIPAATIDEGDPLLPDVRAVLAGSTGTAPPDDVFPATTDATWFSEIGIPSLPAVGPGLIRYAHGADERVSIAALERARVVYRELARRYCEGAA